MNIVATVLERDSVFGGKLCSVTDLRACASFEEEATRFDGVRGGLHALRSIVDQPRIIAVLNGEQVLVARLDENLGGHASPT